ncbi:recombinase family protein [Staphylococcus simiae]|uniref:Uncharacterized protein n=1 Tax=Staphylococcus simiae CCM 7213 = CCUG 51256 TaxID=911238 RepID=G5JK74_9STAP|nr:hypothetical protein [Staphylococcus simiae]EHJ07404.1 hypothetical protein SS7213T_09429 [Staphylococcus simiae CCM 7213 = CCUG 51256]PNZ09483.1 hypothetical protein CD113_12225 [Staphylococcus simiae]SNV54601.1 Uncharacterised protein [Staphylococcus simiae]
MNTIALAHHNTDERSELEYPMPIDIVENFCQSHGYKISVVYEDDELLISDIKNQEIQPQYIIFWGEYDDYPELDMLCDELDIDFITVYPELV